LRHPHDKINGLDALAYSAGHIPMCRFLVLTGYPDTELAISCLRDGVVDYSVKPVEGKRLKEASLQSAVVGLSLGIVIVGSLLFDYLVRNGLTNDSDEREIDLVSAVLIIIICIYFPVLGRYFPTTKMPQNALS
jgi:DNA-binding NarL/FixJ family response regulator